MIEEHEMFSLDPELRERQEAIGHYETFIGQQGARIAELERGEQEFIRTLSEQAAYVAEVTRERDAAREDARALAKVLQSVLVKWDKSDDADEWWDAAICNYVEWRKIRREHGAKYLKDAEAQPGEPSPP